MADTFDDYRYSAAAMRHLGRLGFTEDSPELRAILLPLGEDLRDNGRDVAPGLRTVPVELGGRMLAVTRDATGRDARLTKIRDWAEWRALARKRGVPERWHEPGAWSPVLRLHLAAAAAEEPGPLRLAVEIRDAEAALFVAILRVLDRVGGLVRGPDRATVLGLGDGLHALLDAWGLEVTARQRPPDEM